MKEFNVRILPAAQNDFLDIEDYLNTLSVEAAAQYYGLIMEKMGALATTPDCYPLVRDAQLRLRGYRTLQIEDYIVFYIIHGSNVEIRRILYARRQFERLI